MPENTNNLTSRTYEKMSEMLSNNEKDTATVSTDSCSAVGTNLLGVYNDKNEYIIAPAILQELYAVDKLKKTTFKNSVFCTSYVPSYGDLTFEIIYEKNSKNQTAKATMYLLEKEFKVNGYLQNTIKTKVGEYVSNLEGFVEHSYKEFNINVAPVGSEKIYNVADDEKLQGYIMAKQMFNKLTAELTHEECNSVYERFFTQRLELLNKIDNEFAREILNRFKKEYAKIEKYFLSAKDYKALSELLDKCIEDVSGINPTWAQQEKDYKEKMLPIILMFVDQMNSLNEKATKKARNMLRRKDREKIDLITEQEKTSKAPESNAGKSKPNRPISAIIKADIKKKESASREKLGKLNDAIEKYKTTKNPVVETNKKEEQKPPTTTPTITPENNNDSKKLTKVGIDNSHKNSFVDDYSDDNSSNKYGFKSIEQKNTNEKPKIKENERVKEMEI